MSWLYILLFSAGSSAFAGTCQNPTEVKYTGAEHKQLGDLGFQAACRHNHSLPGCDRAVFYRAANDRAFGYGELVAMGDFYKTPEQGYLDKTPIREINNIYRCIGREGRVHAEQRNHPEVDYPDCLWVFMVNDKDFLVLASTNDTHFGWNNIRTYTIHHSKAIELAVEAHDTQNLELLKKALFINGFADHYLTDSFAAGHIQVPRTQIRQWTKNHLWNPLRAIVGDAFSMILHNNDSKDLHGHEVGLPVKNSRGQVWVTKSDGTLNECTQESDDGIRIPTEAVMYSVLDILDAYQTGERPVGVYKPLEYVPFPVDRQLLAQFPLTGKGKTDDKLINKLKSDLPWPLSWILTDSTLGTLLKKLPTIEQDFLTANKKEYLAHPEIYQHVPMPYIDAFTN